MPKSQSTPEHTTQRVLAGLGAGLVGVIFATDLLLPLGYAGGMPYSIPLVLGFWLGGRYTLVAALAATALTAVGYLYSSDVGALTWIVAINRLGALLTIWVTAGGALLYRSLLREQSRLRDELVLQERLAAVGETAATFAHEVGNPLNSISLHTQLIDRANNKSTTQCLGEPQSTSRITTSVRVILSEIARLGTLLDEFRSLSRKQRLNIAPVRMEQLVDHVLEAHSPSLEAGGIALVRDLTLETCQLDGDADKLTQAILNLLKNATEAMPGGGTLTVRGRVDSRNLQLDIADTGMGIPEGVDILEPFTTTKETGTGLGLPVVLRVVTAHGGSLSWICPQSGGTTFSIRLPRNQQAAAS